MSVGRLYVRATTKGAFALFSVRINGGVCVRAVWPACPPLVYGCVRAFVLPLVCECLSGRRSLVGFALRKTRKTKEMAHAKRGTNASKNRRVCLKMRFIQTEHLLSDIGTMSTR